MSRCPPTVLELISMVCILLGSSLEDEQMSSYCVGTRIHGMYTVGIIAGR